MNITVRILTLLLSLAALVAVALAPRSDAEPSYCFGTRTWMPFPSTQGWCPDSEPPFDGPGPSYGGGDHRWTDGDDE